MPSRGRRGAAPAGHPRRVGTSVNQVDQLKVRVVGTEMAIQHEELRSFTAGGVHGDHLVGGSRCRWSHERCERQAVIEKQAIIGVRLERLPDLTEHVEVTVHVGVADGHRSTDADFDRSDANGVSPNSPSSLRE